MSAIDLLEIARSTGLRNHLHGVSAQDARAMLKAFLDAATAADPDVILGAAVAQPVEWQEEYAPGKWLTLPMGKHQADAKLSNGVNVRPLYAGASIRAN